MADRISSQNKRKTVQFRSRLCGSFYSSCTTSLQPFAFHTNGFNHFSPSNSPDARELVPLRQWKKLSACADSGHHCRVLKCYPDSKVIPQHTLFTKFIMHKVNMKLQENNYSYISVSWAAPLNHSLKALETFGYCQRPVFTIHVSQYMQKIIQPCENLDSIGQENNHMKEKTPLLHIVFFQMHNKRLQAWRLSFSEKLPLSQKRR